MRADRSNKRSSPVTHIAHVIYRLHAGGMENGLINLINEMPNEMFHHDVICVTSSTSFADRIHGSNVRIHELNKKPGKDAALYKRFWDAIRMIAPDIVHTRNLGALDLAPVAAAAGVPIRIHSEHGWDSQDPEGTRYKYRVLRRFCDPFITRYIAVSKSIEEWLRNCIGVAHGKVHRICNGVDTDRFAPDGVCTQWTFPHTDDDPIVVGSVGRLDPIKGFDNLVHAIQLVLEHDPGLRRRLRVVIVGEGPVRKRLEEMIGTAQLGEVISCAGVRDDMPDIFRSFDIFVLASKNEGISNTVLEAMASGLPVVATAVGGTPELVVDGITGHLVASGDNRALAVAIGGYARDIGKREAHGQAGRNRAVEVFGLSRMVDRYSSLYQSVRSGI